MFSSCDFNTVVVSFIFTCIFPCSLYPQEVEQLKSLNFGEAKTDGELDDWEKSDGLLSDESGDGKNGFDVLHFYAKASNSRMFLRVDTKDVIEVTDGNLTNERILISMVFRDNDNNSVGSGMIDFSTGKITITKQNSDSKKEKRVLSFQESGVAFASSKKKGAIEFEVDFSKWIESKWISKRPETVSFVFFPDKVTSPGRWGTGAFAIPASKKEPKKVARN